MKIRQMVCGLGLAAAVLAPASALLAAPAQQGQTADQMKSGQAPALPGETEEQHGRRLLAEMVQALGGPAWLDKQTETIEGQTGGFFEGQPTGSVVKFVEYRRFAQGAAPDLSRVEFVTSRGAIIPGTKRDVIHLWTADNGYEFTFKGRKALPAEQVAGYLRRRAHSIDEVMRTWVKAPGVIVIYAGTAMRDRRPVDKVTVLAATNDAVTFDLDQDTHLPLARTFEWRNQQFKDHDEDEEVYGDWRAYQGIATPMNVTRYHNGDMADQTFYTKVTFNLPLAPELFDADHLSVKK